MDKFFLEVFNQGMSPQEMNAVRGGGADPLGVCTCYSGATYDCGCYSDYICTCHGGATSLVCSANSCACNSSTPFKGFGK